MDEGEFASLAADSLESGLAIVDPAGTITWANTSWRSAISRDAPRGREKGLGTLADLAAGARGGAAAAIEHGIRAVIEGDSASFQLEYQAVTEPHRRFLLSATPLRAESRGAVVMRRQVHPLFERHEPAIGGVHSAESAPPLDRLTPRELQILGLLARGLSNRAIARELGIEYTTVRGYVRTLIEKFGARSRLECVAMAFRWGMVE